LGQLRNCYVTSAGCELIGREQSKCDQKYWIRRNPFPKFLYAKLGESLMDIIERIEIKHFRSFDGGKDQAKVRIDDLSDLNIFSGANDSGKSNVLRALNLFFNNEISPGIQFNKDRDFSKIVAFRFDKDVERRKAEQTNKSKSIESEELSEKPKDIRRSDEVISIKLFFNNDEQQRGLPKSFWISRSYSKKNNFEGEYIYQTDLKGNAQVTLFLNSFKFEYVPAIKDKLFFSYLFEKLQTYLFEKEDKKKKNKFSVSSAEFNTILKDETKELFKNFQVSSGVDANFYIPSTLVDFFRTLSVRTENDISLFDRGDGIQARFIPEILDEIAGNSSKNVIWGFEEPENSYESKNIRKIGEDFLTKYSRKKQIFVTTHTKELLSLKRKYTDKEQEIIDNGKLKPVVKREELSNLSPNNKSSNVSIYRVWKNESTNNTSLVTKFDEKNNEWEKTCDDLGIVQESRTIENLQALLNEQSQEISKSSLSSENQKRVSNELINSLDKKLGETLKELDSVKLKIEEYEKPILIVEDKYDAIYKISFLKLNDVDCNVNNFKELFTKHCYFAIRRAESAGAVAGILSMNNTDGYDEKRLIGLFDFDSEGSENFYHLRKRNNWDKIISGEPSTGLFKKRNQHGCFYAMLVPIPERLRGLISDVRNGKLQSLVEIENLLPDRVLTENGLVTEEEILDRTYYKVKKDRKSTLPKILCELGPENFSDFIPLFDFIENLFGK
jgi:AAA15 family ATPase/GTPase